MSMRGTDGAGVFLFVDKCVRVDSLGTHVHHVYLSRDKRMRVGIK